MKSNKRDFKDRYKFEIKGQTDTLTDVIFKICKPEILKSNLEKKKCRVQKFRCNNKSLPIFIPNRVINSNYFNVTTDATTTVLLNNTLTVNSLEYYVILRDSSNNKAVVSFLQHYPKSYYQRTTPPPYIVTNDVAYYTNTYYYYSYFEYFMDVFLTALKDAYTTYGSGPAINPIFWKNNSGYFQLFIQNSSSWEVELSDGLLELFPFKSYKTTDGYGNNRLIFDTTPATINGGQYYEVDADFYDTIFPFTDLLFVSEDSNINPIAFIGDEALKKNVNAEDYQHTILEYDVATNNFAGIYNFFTYTNEDDSLWVNFNTNAQSKDHLTIQIKLKLRNGTLIPYTLAKGEIFKFMLEIKYEE